MRQPLLGCGVGPADTGAQGRPNRHLSTISGQNDVNPVARRPVILVTNGPDFDAGRPDISLAQEIADRQCPEQRQAPSLGCISDPFMGIRGDDHPQRRICCQAPRQIRQGSFRPLRQIGFPGREDDPNTTAIKNAGSAALCRLRDPCRRSGGRGGCRLRCGGRRGCRRLSWRLGRRRRRCGSRCRLGSRRRRHRCNRRGSGNRRRRRHGRRLRRWWRRRRCCRSRRCLRRRCRRRGRRRCRPGRCC